jgi:hypothetical protein
MLRRLLSAAALLLLLASSAQASTINLLLTTDINDTTLGPPELLINFKFFESPENGWPYTAHLLPKIELAHGTAIVLPGVTQFDITLDTNSLDDIYFTAWGFYKTFDWPEWNRYVAEPPTGSVSDGLVYGYGPVWIPLADLGAGFSGNFQYFWGNPRGPIGSWSIDAAPAPVTPVPEPASLLLFGSGLAAVASKKYRRKAQLN